MKNEYYETRIAEAKARLQHLAKKMEDDSVRIGQLERDRALSDASSKAAEEEKRKAVAREKQLAWYEGQMEREFRMWDTVAGAKNPNACSFGRTNDPSDVRTQEPKRDALGESLPPRYESINEAAARISNKWNDAIKCQDAVPVPTPRPVRCLACGREFDMSKDRHSFAECPNRRPNLGRCA